MNLTLEIKKKFKINKSSKKCILASLSLKIFFCHNSQEAGNNKTFTLSGFFGHSHVITCSVNVDVGLGEPQQIPAVLPLQKEEL